MVGGGFQILSMMLFFPILLSLWMRLRFSIHVLEWRLQVISLVIVVSLAGATNVALLLIPAALIMSAVGVLNVIITIFLANTVDYGELKNHRRDESVIFSVQTFVVKLASRYHGICIFYGIVYFPYQQ